MKHMYAVYLNNTDSGDSVMIAWSRDREALEARLEILAANLPRWCTVSLIEAGTLEMLPGEEEEDFIPYGEKVVLTQKQGVLDDK